MYIYTIAIDLAVEADTFPKNSLLLSKPKQLWYGIPKSNISEKQEEKKEKKESSSLPHQ